MAYNRLEFVEAYWNVRQIEMLSKQKDILSDDFADELRMCANGSEHVLFLKKKSFVLATKNSLERIIGRTKCCLHIDTIKV